MADPYRWLEDAESAETHAWVRRQNAVTEAHLATLADRAWFSSTMTAIVGRPRAGVPSKKSGHYFVSRNDGTQNQDVIYVADSLTELLIVCCDGFTGLPEAIEATWAQATVQICVVDLIRASRVWYGARRAHQCQSQ